MLKVRVGRKCRPSKKRIACPPYSAALAIRSNAKVFLQGRGTRKCGRRNKVAEPDSTDLFLAPPGDAIVRSLVSPYLTYDNSTAACNLANKQTILLVDVCSFGGRRRRHRRVDGAALTISRE